MDQKTPHNSDLTVVYRSSWLAQAELIKGRLESAGIPAILNYESLGRVMGVTFDSLGQVRVLVPHQYAQDAQLLLSEPSGEDQDDLPDVLAPPPI